MFILVDINSNILDDKTVLDYFKFTFACNGIESLFTEHTGATENSITCLDHVLVKRVMKNKIEIKASVNSFVWHHYLTAVQM